MSSAAPSSTAGIEYVPMSFEEYLALPDKPKAEWVDGVAVIYTMAPVSRHSSLQFRLAHWFATHFPDLWGGTEADTWLPANRMRRPDLAMALHTPEGDWINGTEAPPLLVLEILSPSTRSEDLFRKGAEYASAGIAQYWVVDPDDERSIEVNDLVDGSWQRQVRVTSKQPTASVVVPGHDPVQLDFHEIFRD
ncbi:MAG: Uma2 family endonuclease [Nocardioidaceae bacterium]|nr:Uma2 family endonuclease [Nocardioidaceae bacterium]